MITLAARFEAFAVYRLTDCSNSPKRGSSNQGEVWKVWKLSFCEAQNSGAFDVKFAYINWGNCQSFSKSTNARRR